MSQGEPRKHDRRRRAQLPEQIVGARRLRPLQRLLEQLRDTQQADAHGNRKLFLDDMLIALLLAFFNPTIRSLRMIEDLSQTPAAGKHLSLDRLPRATLADAQAVCDPTLLHPILQHLARSLPPRSPQDKDLAQLTRQVLAVDASYYTALADLHWALRHTRSNGKPASRTALHVQLNIDDGTPRHVDVTGRGASEAEVAIAHIQSETIYLFDRGYVSFNLMRACLKNNADLVMRLTTQTRITEVQPLALSQADQQAGVISDRRVVLSGCSKSDPPTQMLREVLIDDPDHPGKPIRLLTSLMDLSAAQIGLLYRKRWQVELFFRWLKVYAQFDHLLSHSQAGVTLNFYVATIGVMLLCLHHQRRPSKYDLAMLAQVAAGAATLDDVGPILAERHRQSQRDRIARAKRLARQGRAPSSRR